MRELADDGAIAIRLEYDVSTGPGRWALAGSGRHRACHYRHGIISNQARLGLAAERRSHTRPAAPFRSGVGVPCGRIMPIPVLNLIEPRDAVRRVRDAFDCTEAGAVQFLCDRWLAGEITPRFIGGAPPGGADPVMADWFAGAIILADKWLPRRAISEPGNDPEWQRIPGRSFPFKLDRQQLETALTRGHTGGPPPERRWSGILPLPEAVSRAYPDLAPHIERYVAQFGDLPLREPKPGAPGGRRVVLILSEEDEAHWARSAEPCPDYWMPPAPGVYPGAELARRLQQGSLYELTCKADGGDWEPVAMALLKNYRIDYSGSTAYLEDHFASRAAWLRLGIRLRRMPPARGAAGDPESLVPAPAPSKVPYGDKSARVFDWVSTHRTELMEIPNRKLRARRVAKETDCSPSLVEKILKNEGL